MKIGLLRETKIPQDNRVAFSPKQCRTMLDTYPNLSIEVQPSPHRCFTDEEYAEQGITINEDLSNCDILFGVKEVKIDTIIPHKTYCIFSHTKKKQPYNQGLLKAFLTNQNRLVDYECLTHDDGQRVVGFGYFAGVVGAHHGILTYGKKWNLFSLPPCHSLKNFEALKDLYFNTKLPPFKAVVTGSGRVASGLLEVMHLLDIKMVDIHDYIHRDYSYPVYTHLHGKDLYARKSDGNYYRDEFHSQPHLYRCLFNETYWKVTDILFNGIYWDKSIPRLFELNDIQNPHFKINTISDVTCDENGSVPCNQGASTIADPVYGFNRTTLQKDQAYQADHNIIDVMAVDNLPNELPRDASKFFGEYLMKYIIPDLIAEDHTTPMLQRATITNGGHLGRYYEYLTDYAQ